MIRKLIDKAFLSSERIAGVLSVLNKNSL